MNKRTSSCLSDNTDHKCEKKKTLNISAERVKKQIHQLTHSVVWPSASIDETRSPATPQDNPSPATSRGKITTPALRQEVQRIIDSLRPNSPGPREIKDSIVTTPFLVEVRTILPYVVIAQQYSRVPIIKDTLKGIQQLLNDYEYNNLRKQELDFIAGLGTRGQIIPGSEREVGPPAKRICTVTPQIQGPIKEGSTL